MYRSSSSLGSLVVPGQQNQVLRHRRPDRTSASEGFGIIAGRKAGDRQQFACIWRHWLHCGSLSIQVSMHGTSPPKSLPS